MTHAEGPPKAAGLKATSNTWEDSKLQASANFRTALVSFLAAGIGLLAGVIAYVLQKLIAFLTTLVFFW